MLKLLNNAEAMNNAEAVAQLNTAHACPAHVLTMLKLWPEFCSHKEHLHHPMFIAICSEDILACKCCADALHCSVHLESPHSGLALVTFSKIGLP